MTRSGGSDPRRQGDPAARHGWRWPRRPAPHPVRRVVVRTWRIVRFLVYFGWEFLLSNATVLWEILTPRQRGSPAVVAVPLRSRTRREVVSFANLVTLTPGTLSLELTWDPPVLYLHGMFVHDPAQFTAQLYRLEDQMLAAMQPVGAPDAETR